MVAAIHHLPHETPIRGYERRTKEENTGWQIFVDIATQKSQLCVKRHHLVRLLIPIIATRLPQHT